jgi:hypothetical protein
MQLQLSLLLYTGSKYGENMDDGLAVKANALEILDKQLASRAKKNEVWNCSSGIGPPMHTFIMKKD